MTVTALKERVCVGVGVDRLLVLEKVKERGFWCGYNGEDSVCPYRSGDKVRAFWVGVGLGKASKLGEGGELDLLGLVLGSEESARYVRECAFESVVSSVVEVGESVESESVAIDDCMGDVEFELCDLGEGDLLGGRGAIQVKRGEVVKGGRGRSVVKGGSNVVAGGGVVSKKGCEVKKEGVKRSRRGLVKRSVDGVVKRSRRSLVVNR